MQEFMINEILAKNGESSIEINNYLIHSKYNPTKEAKKYIEAHYRAHNLNIVFGYGSGYFVEEIIKIRNFDEKVIVIDPLLDNGMINILPKHYDVLGVKVNDIPFLESILINLDSEIRTSFNVICTNHYDKLFPKEYKKLLQKIRDIQESNRVNDNTLILFAERWQENLAMNLTYMSKDASLEVLKNMSEKPVIIASSGPSLLKQLPLLKEYKESIILISSGSTTNVLINNDITPDFIVTIDGGEANYKHFKNLYIKNSKLIYSFQNHYKIRNSFEGQAYVCNLSGHSHVNGYIDAFLETSIPELIAGSTVANLSFSVAQYISSGPIAFIGQDLAYTNNLSHVQGHNHTQNISNNITENKGIVMIEGYFNDKIATSPSMNSMRMSFEKMILNSPPRNKFYNCTEGGAKINGFEQITFEKFGDMYIKNNKNQSIKSPLNNQFEVVGILEKEKITAKFNKDLIKAKELITLYEKALLILDKDKSLERFKANTLKKLEFLDDKILTLLGELPLDHILTPTVMEVKRGYLAKNDETVYQKFNRIKKQNVKFYKNSLIGVKKFCEYLEQALKYNEVEQ